MSYFISSENEYNIMSTTITEVDKSENSMVYNTQFPVAMELSNCLLNLDEALKKVFATTTNLAGYDYYLDLRCAEMGIFRKQATYAIFPVKITGKPNKTFFKGSIVSTLDNRCYTTETDVKLDENGIGYVNVKAEKSGSDYNVKANEVCYLPIEYSGILTVTNEEDYTDAYNRETNEELYNRYSLKVKKVVTSGNKNMYEQWCKEVVGVGDVQVIPLWNGRGTVKCVITDSNKRKASDELIQKVKEYIDPSGEYGEGEAPIGATLTVTTVEEVPINITAKVELMQGNGLEDIKSLFEGKLQDYFDNNVYYNKKVSFAKTEALLISLNEVSDVDDSSIKINGATSNIILTSEQIPVIGTITLEEM